MNERKIKGYLVFMYKNTSGYNYLKIPDLSNLMDSGRGEHVRYSKQPNASTTSGVIVEHLFDADSDAVYSLKSKQTSYCGFWKNTSDVLLWKEFQRQFHASTKNLSEAKKINLEQELTRIKNVYYNLPPAQRSQFIAQVVYEITKR